MIFDVREKSGGEPRALSRRRGTSRLPHRFETSRSAWSARASAPLSNVVALDKLEKHGKTKLITVFLSDRFLAEWSCAR
jgi:hypothetical protein